MPVWSCGPPTVLVPHPVAQQYDTVGVLHPALLEVGLGLRRALHQEDFYGTRHPHRAVSVHGVAVGLRQPRLHPAGHVVVTVL